MPRSLELTIHRMCSPSLCPLNGFGNSCAVFNSIKKTKVFFNNSIGKESVLQLISLEIALCPGVWQRLLRIMYQQLEHTATKMMKILVCKLNLFYFIVI